MFPLGNKMEIVIKVFADNVPYQSIERKVYIMWHGNKIYGWYYYLRIMLYPADKLYLYIYIFETMCSLLVTQFINT